MIRVTVLGSADAFNSAGRGCACYLVQDDRGAYCVDFGPTALQALKARGSAPEDLDAVFLTHLHGDHFGGLHLLLIDAQYRCVRRRPLLIGGPCGTARKVEKWYELAWGSAARQRPFPVRYLEWPPGGGGRAGGRSIRTFAAHHMASREGALSLRIRCDDTVLAFTGDTGWTEDLLALAKDADLFVCECTDDKPVTETHLSWERLRPRLGLLGARRVLLTHFGDAMRSLAGRIAAPPRVQFAEDGMVIRLPSSPGRRVGR